MKEDTFERISKFLEGDEDLPERVSNQMILIAIRDVRDEVKEVNKILFGNQLDGLDGLVQRVNQLEKALKMFLWLVSPIILAGLGALGAYLLETILNYGGNMEQILNWLVGAIGVPLIQWIKTKFGVEGKTAMWLTSIVSLALGFLLLLITNEFEIQEMNFETLALVFGQVLSSATLVYKLILKNE